MADFEEAISQINEAIIHRVQSKELNRLINDIRNGSQSKIDLSDYRLPAELINELKRNYRCRTNELVLDSDSLSSSSVVGKNDNNDNNTWSPNPKTPPEAKFHRPRASAPGAPAPTAPEKRSTSTVPSKNTKRNIASAFSSDKSIEELLHEKQEILKEIQNVDNLIGDAEVQSHKKLLLADKAALLERAQKNSQQIRQYNQSLQQPLQKKLKSVLKSPSTTTTKTTDAATKQNQADKSVAKFSQFRIEEPDDIVDDDDDDDGGKNGDGNNNNNNDADDDD